MSDRLVSAPPPGPNGLAAQVVDYVRDYIATHGLKPGDRLPGETEIARALGVSRPVVREASRTLLALGAIATAPGRAPRVGAMDSHVLRHVFEHAIVTGEADARQVLEVRRGLEIAMAAQAAMCRDDAAAAELAALSAAMGARLRDPEAFVALDLAFHRTIAQATANPFYVVLIEACRAAFAASMDAGLRQRLGRAELERVHKLHAEIVDAVRARDAASAADAMTRHFDDALAALYRPARPRRRTVAATP
jgi:GntR family transcriptional regulator, transcriptional repressor for pyruvate dehydrogenase complex